jgi:photosynthetic reaction center cytochrome c subunit
VRPALYLDYSKRLHIIPGLARLDCQSGWRILESVSKKRTLPPSPTSRNVIPRSHHTPQAQATVWFFLILLVALGCATLLRGQSSNAAIASHNSLPFAQSSSGQPPNASRCAFCHPAEVEGYSRSAMAHSLRRAGQEPDGTVSAHGSKITMHSTAGGYWQRWENGGDANNYRIDYVVGSGTHASGYLVDIGGHLFQSPVAFYTSRQSYGLAPGYENQPDPDFTRPVSEECVLCHSGTALHISGTLNQYRSPVFPAEAITCERCHGPAEKHLADPRAGTIVNPAKLEPAARDSICEQCHLFGAARVANPGRKLSDFMPGQRLEDTFTIYRNAVAPGSSPGAFKVISHVEQLALSACARNSGGRLWCGTCHNPHDKPLQPVLYYRARCLGCHNANFAPSHPPQDSDCLSCHMPRRDAKDGGHTAFTDHRIQRRPETEPDLPPDTGITAWREPQLELQRRNLGIADIDVGMQRHSSSLVVQGYRALTEVQRQFSSDSDFFKWIGEALLLGRKTADAKIALERALQLDPDSALTEASAASPYIQEGDTGSAIAHLERAVTIDPLFLPAASTLIDLYQKQGKTAEAAALSARMKTAMAASLAADQPVDNHSSSSSYKKTEEVFKNIQVLKGVPSRQLIPAMEFMASSLGVECGFCHVEGHFEKDDKKTKQTARAMMKMMFSLNNHNFEGRSELSCYSCHRGARNPIATPVVDTEMQPQGVAAGPEVQRLPTNLPTASQLIDGYIQALGGRGAIEKITSRLEKGTGNFHGKSASFEIFTQAPEKQAVVRHLPEGDGVVAFNGQTGWFRSPGHPTRDMQNSDLEAARMDADLHFALHVQHMCPELRVEYPETIGDRQAYVLVCIREGPPAVKLYFDEQSQLLVRLVRYSQSPIGRNPTQIDYADYRVVDGLQIPFRVTSSEPANRATLQIESVQQNVPVDDARFVKP